MNEIVYRRVLEHSGFDKLKYNLEYYREHMAEKKAYNKEYYRQNKDKWGIHGNRSNANSSDQNKDARLEAEKQADAKKLTGLARDQFIKSYMKKYKTYTHYDEPIGPAPRKKSSVEKAADKVFAHIPGYGQLYNGSVYNFLNSGKRFIKQVASIGKISKKAMSFVDNFSDEDLKNIKNKLNEMQRKINAVEGKVNSVKSKIEQTVNRISF